MLSAGQRDGPNEFSLSHFVSCFLAEWFIDRIYDIVFPIQSEVIK